MHKKIETVEVLKTESRDGAEFFILLHGNLRSSKHIFWDNDAQHFEIINLVDSTEQILTESELMDRGNTNIGYAMTMGALFKYQKGVKV